MANSTKTYFLAPSWDYPPDGRIRLGNIITSPLKAAQPLNFSSRKEPKQDELILSDKVGTQWTREKQRDGKYGVWTTFLSFLGLGVDASISHNSGLEDDYAFDRIDTVEFFPTETYLVESMRDPEVIKFIEMSRLRRSIYMIVGIKTVTGAKAKTSRASGLGGQLKVSLDGTLTGAPVSLGPEVEANTKGREGFAFEGSSDFVFAFRVRKIKLTRKGEMRGHDDHTKGALFDAEIVAVDRSMPFEIQGLETCDVTHMDVDCQLISEAAEDSETVEVCAGKA